LPAFQTGQGGNMLTLVKPSATLQYMGEIPWQPALNRSQRELLMKTINVDNIPEPVVRAMEVVVQTLREQFHEAEKPRPQVDLPIWPGTVFGNLSRTEIYQDVE
jgi:hypothetical protein